MAVLLESTLVCTRHSFVSLGKSNADEIAFSSEMTHLQVRMAVSGSLTKVLLVCFIIGFKFGD